MTEFNKYKLFFINKKMSQQINIYNFTGLDIVITNADGSEIGAESNDIPCSELKTMIVSNVINVVSKNYKEGNDKYYMFKNTINVPDMRNNSVNLVLGTFIQGETKFIACLPKRQIKINKLNNYMLEGVRVNDSVVVAVVPEKEIIIIKDNVQYNYVAIFVIVFIIIAILLIFVSIVYKYMYGTR